MTKPGNLERGEWIFPCDCSNGDYLRMRWDEHDPDWRFLWIESHALHSRQPWRRRVARAWSALRGRDWQAAEIVLTEETVARVRSVLEVRP